jgi:hypothetical protein
MPIVPSSITSSPRRDYRGGCIDLNTGRTPRISSPSMSTSTTKVLPHGERLPFDVSVLVGISPARFYRAFPEAVARQANRL